MIVKYVKFITKTVCPVVLSLLFISGCESDKSSTVTTSLFNREPSSLEEVSVDPDSIGIDTLYKNDIGSMSNMFAGSLESVQSFSVLKFSRPGQALIDSLDSALLTITVRDVWGSGLPSYSLYTTSVDWDEGDRLDPDAFLDVLGEPIQTVTDTTTDISSLVFSIPGNIIDSWDDSGAFLLKGADENTTIAYLSSDNATSAPNLKMYTRSTSSKIDSTTITCKEGTYCLTTGHDEDAPLISNGDARGYVFSIALPELNSHPAPINKCDLTFTLGDHFFADDEMSIIMYRLTAEFTTIDDVETDLTAPLNVTLTADSTSYILDISAFVSDWFNGEDPNYGLLVKPYNTGTRPDYAIFSPADSLSITYTTLPEVR